MPLLLLCVAALRPLYSRWAGAGRGFAGAHVRRRVLGLLDATGSGRGAFLRLCRSCPHWARTVVLYSSGSGSGVSSPAFPPRVALLFLVSLPGLGLDTWHRYLVDVLPTSPRKRYVKNFSLNGLLARFVLGVPSLNAPVALPDDAWLWILRTSAALGPALLTAYLTRAVCARPRQSSGSCTA